MKFVDKQIKTRVGLADDRDFVLAVTILLLAIWCTVLTIGRYSTETDTFAANYQQLSLWILLIGGACSIFLFLLSVYLFFLYYVSNIKLSFLEINGDELIWPKGLFLSQNNVVALKDIRSVHLLKKNGLELLIIKTLSKKYTLSRKMMFRNGAYQEICGMVQEVALLNKR
ncbi:MAG: hypothetical protein COA36_09835 [Desulfotalea sp.]|nr:MAG: hypothetical protein COA36_09835 [Desulfotalea sp.]